MPRNDSFKVGETIDATIKLPSSLDLTDRTVILQVFDATDTLDAAQSGAMSVGSKPYKFSKDFTPDANGQWSTEIFVEDDIDPGTPIYGPFFRDYSVGNYNQQSIGANVATVESKVDSLQTSVNEIDISDPPMLG